jgi:hypothetical protein
MFPLDTAAARRRLADLAPRIAALQVDPSGRDAVALELSHLGSLVTAACEAAFLSLVGAGAA